MRYDALVFDADGVLCEPTDLGALRRAIRRAFRAHGVDDPPPDAVDRLLGTTPADLRAVCDELAIADVAGFWRDRDRHASAAQRAAIRRGEKRLYDDVSAVTDLPVGRAVVSNNQQATVAFLLDHAGLADRFHPVIGRAPTLADVANKKPSPHHVERAVAALGAERPLFVGDSNVDLGAAAAAGIDAAFVRREHRRDYALEYEPTHELTSLAELADLVTPPQRAAADD